MYIYLSMYIGKINIVQQRTADGPLCHAGFVRHVLQVPNHIEPFWACGFWENWMSCMVRCQGPLQPNDEPQCREVYKPFLGACIGCLNTLYKAVSIYGCWLWAETVLHILWGIMSCPVCVCVSLKIVTCKRVVPPHCCTAFGDWMRLLSR